MKKYYTTGIKLFMFFFLLTGVLYPLLITFFAKLFFPSMANGSFIEKNGVIVGSKLISQNSFHENYFWPRPSAISYDPSKASRGTNIGPTDKHFYRLLNERKKIYGEHAPSDLLFASASGLDPHISIEAANYQIPRIAHARSMKESVIKKIINENIEGSRWGLIGPKYINVLVLNLALDENDVRRNSKKS